MKTLKNLIQKEGVYMRLSAELAKVYYTASEAREVLGIDEEAFQYWGRTKRVNRIYLPGRKQAVYSKNEVNKIASRIEATIIAEQPDGFEFRKAVVADLEAEYELSYLIFGKGAHTIETRRGFIEHNPDVDYHLYDHEKLVSFITIIPFDHETIERFITGQERGWELDPQNIKQFEPGEPLECILMEMATTPTVPPAKRTAYGSHLLSNLSDVFTIWGEHGVMLTNFYATSSTPTGIRILNTAGFQVAHDLGRGRFAFKLSIKESNSKLVRNYKEALEEWQKKSSRSTRKAKVKVSTNPIT